MNSLRMLDEVALRACTIAAICDQLYQCISLPDCSKPMAVAHGFVLQWMLSTDSAGDILLVLIWAGIARL